MARFITTVALMCALTQAPDRGPLSYASGAPGDRATWTNGNKQGIGTAVTPISKVWFTLGDGVFTEAHYPMVDTPAIVSADFGGR